MFVVLNYFKSRGEVRPLSIQRKVKPNEANAATWLSILPTFDFPTR